VATVAPLAQDRLQVIQMCIRPPQLEQMARVRTNAHPLPVLHSWLDSWNGLGAVVTGMERQGYDGASPDTPKAGAPRSFHGTTRRGRGWVRC
jgi:hypothetical protein